MTIEEKKHCCCAASGTAPCGCEDEKGHNNSACGCTAEASTGKTACDGESKTTRCDCSMPQVTFSTFVLSLASSALVQLGEVPNPDSGTLEPDLVMAQHSIDILTMLQTKTAHCLDADESRLLEGLIYELRMKYVLKKG